MVGPAARFPALKRREEREQVGYLKFISLPAHKPRYCALTWSTLCATSAKCRPPNRERNPLLLLISLPPSTADHLMPAASSRKRWCCCVLRQGADPAKCH